MAIQKTFTVSNNGLTVDSAYHKIDSILIENKMAIVMVSTYASKEARDSNLESIIVKRYVTTLDELSNYIGDDILAKAYDFLKKSVTLYQTETTDV